MNWNKVSEVGLPEKDKPCLVYKPNNPYAKIQVDTWSGIWESPVSWSTHVICVGEGWESGDEYEDVTHWMYVPEDPID